MGVCVYVCMGMGIWVYECMSVCGCMGVLVYGYMGV